MATYTVAYMAVYRAPGEMGGHREQTAQFDRDKPVLEVIRELGRMGAVYREPEDLYDLVERLLKATGQKPVACVQDAAGNWSPDWDVLVNRAAQQGRNDRIAASRRFDRHWKAT